MGGLIGILVLVVALCVTLSLSVLIVWLVWRAVKKPVSIPPPAAGGAAPAEPGQRPLSWAWVGVPLAVHAVIVVGAMFFFVVTVPRFANVFQELDVPLPVVTQFTVNLAHVVSAWWFVLSLPGLSLVDLAPGVAARRTNNRHVVLTWGVGVAAVVILMVLVCGVSLSLPQAAAIHQMNAVPSSR